MSSHATPPALPSAPGPVDGIGAVGTGILAVFGGLRRLVSTPRMWPPVIGIALIQAMLLAGAIVLGWSLGDDLIAWLVGPTPDAWGWALLHGVTVFLTRAALIGVMVVVSWLLGGVFAGPLYDRLSATVETMDGTLPVDDTGWSQILGDILQGIRHSLLSIVLYGLCLGAMLPVLLVPGAGELAWPVLTGALSSAFLAREMFDYPTSRRRWPYRAKLAMLREHPALAAGLGVTTFFGLMIPLLNLIVMSSAVVAATALFPHLPGSTQDPAAPPAG